MEVHFIGELRGVRDLDLPDLTCRFKVINDESWRLLSGQEEGFTQICSKAETDLIVWNHPLDLHFTTDSVTNWPRLYLEVWSRDQAGRNTIAAYGHCRLPSTPGESSVDCVLWRPYGTFVERLSSFFLGNHPQLLAPEEAVCRPTRFPLVTEPKGTAMVTINTIVHSQNSGVVLNHEGE